MVSKTLHVITFTGFLNVFQRFFKIQKRDFLRFFCFAAYIFSNNGTALVDGGL